MAVYTVGPGTPVSVKVEYSDLAGGFAGWFLLAIQGDVIGVDGDLNPANGPDSYAALGNAIVYSTSNPLTGDVTSGNYKYREPFLRLVNERLNKMFGVGHSATWTATIVESVTPAVIDDNW